MKYVGFSEAEKEIDPVVVDAGMYAEEAKLHLEKYGSGESVLVQTEALVSIAHSLAAIAQMMQRREFMDDEIEVES